MVRIVVVVLVLAVIGLSFWLWTPDRPRSELERRHPAGRGVDVEAAGIQLNVRDDGPKDGAAVIFLHGLGASLETWDAVAMPLSSGDAAMRAIRLDLPGFGLTGPDPTGDYSDARSVAVLAALMDRLGLQRASLVGNSLGGRIAWKFAAAHPDRVDRLVLISPDGFASPGFEYGKAPEIPFVLRLLPHVLPKFMLRMQLEPAYGDKAALTGPLLDRYHDMMRAPGVRQALLDRTAQTVLERPEPILSLIQAPTLLVWGEKDALIPFANSADYLGLIRGSTLAPLPGIGHLPQEESPARLLAVLRSFLAP
jgi:pimeloyl-ACP methyl ester carboxylesterase